MTRMIWQAIGVFVREVERFMVALHDDEHQDSYPSSVSPPPDPLPTPPPGRTGPDSARSNRKALVASRTTNHMPPIHR